ncbi:MAG: gamma-glutamyl-gamma-aminobutyrate hydrolase family protein, partial [Dactylosporangium sp.]|nr:gamma-glutamyl-gamma-aminobutyrate hydrolase family protein [Dactylosporangium sp.]
MTETAQGAAGTESVASRRARVVVLDFGAQYAQLICRRVREAGVYADLWPYDAPREDWDGPDVRAIILSGGPESVYEEGAPDIDPAVLDGRPVLGICYGMQWMARALGGRVTPSTSGGYGRARLRILRPSPLWDGTPEGLDVWMSHGDQVLSPPEGFEVLASSGDAPVAA